MQDLEQHFVAAIGGVMLGTEVTEEEENLLGQGDTEQVYASLTVDRYLLQLEETGQFFPIFILLIDDGDPSRRHPFSQQPFHLQ